MTCSKIIFDKAQFVQLTNGEMIRFCKDEFMLYDTKMDQIINLDFQIYYEVIIHLKS